MRLPVVCLLIGFIAANAQEPPPPEGAGIPISFNLKEAGFVTFVVEDAAGVRVRNLVSETEFPAGENRVFWDGLDDLERDLGAAQFGTYHVPGKVVPLGEYTIRGLVRPKIGLTYELAPYTNGKPAWFTADKSSGWLANHSAPQGMLFLPAGAGPERKGKVSSKGGQILVGSHVSEGGSGLAWLDLDGNKLHGQEWVGGNWTAATHFARDEGTRPVAGVYAYTGAAFTPSNAPAELRLNELLMSSEWGAKPQVTRLGTGEDRPVLPAHYKIPNLSPKKPDHDGDDILNGLAVHDGLLVAALAPLNQLLFVDARQRKVLGTAELKDPRGLRFDRQGRLWAVSGKQLLRFTMAENPAVLGTPEVIVGEGLEDPQQLAFDGKGNVYVGDWGTSHQVKVFSTDGRLLRSIGKPGAPSVGPYDPLHMNHPAGVDIDDRGRLWVAEKDQTPKRVSVWSKDGVLEKAFYGPARYGGGGSLDPRDQSVFYYGDSTGGMRLKLDWETGASVPTDLYYRQELDPVPLYGQYKGCSPDTALPFGERTYLTNAYNSDPTSGVSMAQLFILENGVARSVAAMGNAQSGDSWLPAFRTEAFAPLMPKNFDRSTNALFFAWSDQNGDREMQPGEVVFQSPEHPTKGNRTMVGGVTVQKDLSFIVATYGDTAVRFKPSGFTKAGVPIYSATQPEVLAKGVSMQPSSGGGQVLAGRDGWATLTTAPSPFSPYSIAGVRNGKPVWSYPNLWPGLHASHNAAMPTFPGELVGATRLLGPAIEVPGRTGADALWAVNGNKGTIYVFTMDGLFVATLFQDSRSASWSVPEATPGMAVDKLSLTEEGFYPQITQMNDGKVYLQVGTNDGPIRIVRVTGLDGIRRLPEQKIKVTENLLRTAAEAARLDEVQRQESRLPKKVRVPLLGTSVKVDGDGAEWKLANWAPIDSRRVQLGDWGGKEIKTRSALAVSNGRLYGVLETDDLGLLKNSGTSLQTLFKTGGGWDIMLGAEGADPQRMSPVDGDLRVLISQVNGKPTAMVYRPVVAGGVSEPVKFTSPVKETRIDRIEDVSADLELAAKLEKDGKGTILAAVYEFSLPLARLGLKPMAGQTIRGDLGVLRGDGLRTMQRIYWNNKSSGLVSDIPSEAELIPRLWGTLQFQAAP